MEGTAWLDIEGDVRMTLQYFGISVVWFVCVYKRAHSPERIDSPVSKTPSLLSFGEGEGGGGDFKE